MQDQLFLPTLYELIGENAMANPLAEIRYYQGRPFEYYYTAMAPDQSKRVKYGMNTLYDASADSWWTASPATGSSTEFIAIDSTGAPVKSNSNIVRGIAPCFIVSE